MGRMGQLFIISLSKDVRREETGLATMSALPLHSFIHGDIMSNSAQGAPYSVSRRPLCFFSLCCSPPCLFKTPFLKTKHFCVSFKVLFLCHRSFKLTSHRLIHIWNWTFTVLIDAPWKKWDPMFCIISCSEFIPVNIVNQTHTQIGPG